MKIEHDSFLESFVKRFIPKDQRPNLDVLHSRSGHSFSHVPKYWDKELEIIGVKVNGDKLICKKKILAPNDQYLLTLRWAPKISRSVDLETKKVEP